jgi:hypothetical protein
MDGSWQRAEPMTRRAMVVDWLIQHGATYTDFASLSGILAESGLPEHLIAGDISWLDDHQCIAATQAMGGVEVQSARLEPEGADLVAELKRQRDDPRARRQACRAAILRWLDEAGSDNQQLAAFDASTHAWHLGTRFDTAERDRALQDLKEFGLIRGGGAWGGPAVLRPSLTGDGRVCAEDYDGDVTAWRSAVRGGTVSIVGDNNAIGHGNAIGEGNAVAHSNSGATVIASAPVPPEFFDVLAQLEDVIAGAALSESDATTVGEALTEIHAQATATTPNHRLLRALLRTVGLVVTGAAGSASGDLISHLLHIVQ